MPKYYYKSPEHSDGDSIEIPNPTELLARNKEWAGVMTRHDPEFFARLVAQQSPKYLWIGCSDSRVPANEIVGLAPGEMFVHRNVGNLVIQDDLNCLSVLQYAVDVLKVEHVIVSGHYGCGGIKAAMDHSRLGLIDTWLKGVQKVMDDNSQLLEQLDSVARWDALCELNVESQIAEVAKTEIVRRAWERGQKLSLHGWIYGLTDGILRELLVVDGPGDGSK